MDGLWNRKGWDAMSVSAETYIVISLMFAVFAAFAAVGTSVVLGAGFERLRAGFDQVKRQSGFFSDAIYKLDQRTQKLDEETAKLKAGAYSLHERVDRVEKTSTFLADSINSIEQRILQGTPMQPQHAAPVMQPVQAPKMRVQQGWVSDMPMHKTPKPQQQENLVTPLFCDAPVNQNQEEFQGDTMSEAQDGREGLTTLLARYLTGETSGSGKGVVYH